MENKIKYLKYQKLLDYKRKDFMMSQDKISIEYNINSLKNELLKGMSDKNEK